MYKNKSFFYKFLVIIYIFIISLIMASCSGNKIDLNQNNDETTDKDDLLSEVENDAEDVFNDEQNLIFTVGETIKYKLVTVIGHIGNQLFQVLDYKEFEGTMCYYVKSVTTLIPEIEQQFNYKFEDIIYAYIDSETMLPKKVIKDSKQGNYENFVEITFNQEEKKGFYKDKRHHSKGKDFEWQAENGLFDLLSAIYNIRSKKLKIGDKFNFYLLNEDNFSTIEGVVEVKVGDKFEGLPTIRLNQINDEDSVNSISMRLINNDDRNWIPVNITIGILKLGNLTIKLEGYISSYSIEGDNN